MFFQVFTQRLFALTGVVLLSRIEGEEAATLTAWCAKGLVLTGLVLAAFFAVQRTAARPSSSAGHRARPPLRRRGRCGPGRRRGAGGPRRVWTGGAGCP